LDYRISKHAEEELIIRDIPRELLEQVMRAPQQIIRATETADIYQSKVQMREREYLLRVVVAHDVEPKLVITLYRTTKIDKYWSPDESNL
jgi:hypothetical protein